MNVERLPTHDCGHLIVFCFIYIPIERKIAKYWAKGPENWCLYFLVQ